MESILETLYINLNRPQTPYDPELERDKEEYLKMCDMLKAQYGLEFLDRMSALENKIHGRSPEREFSFGFRACARLILETLGDYPPTSP